MSVICAPGWTACALTCVTTCGAAFTGALLSTETAWPTGATSRCALRAGLRFDGVKSVGRSAGSAVARARTRTPAPGSVGVKAMSATPLAPVSTRSGSPSAPVASSVTSTSGTGRPAAPSTWTRSSASRPATIPSGSVARTR